MPYRRRHRRCGVDGLYLANVHGLSRTCVIRGVPMLIAVVVRTECSAHRSLTAPPQRPASSHRLECRVCRAHDHLAQLPQKRLRRQRRRDRAVTYLQKGARRGVEARKVAEQRDTELLRRRAEPDARAVHGHELGHSVSFSMWRACAAATARTQAGQTQPRAGPGPARRRRHLMRLDETCKNLHKTGQSSRKRMSALSKIVPLDKLAYIALKNILRDQKIRRAENAATNAHGGGLEEGQAGGRGKMLPTQRLVPGGTSSKLLCSFPECRQLESDQMEFSWIPASSQVPFVMVSSWESQPELICGTVGGVPQDMPARYDSIEDSVRYQGCAKKNSFSLHHALQFRESDGTRVARAVGSRAHGRSPPTRRGRTKGNMEKWLVENENLETNSKLEQLRSFKLENHTRIDTPCSGLQPLYRCWGIAEYSSRLKDSSSPDVMSVETSMGQRNVSLDSCINEPFQESEEVSNPKRNYPNFRGGGWFMK
ncbi:hypothetical protein GGX14DRAFT_608533 [Mycena pura]|uniref:Uncharacterized protein n=1 Tax=Mycena pura TaxID=153505 RepID=A0AAD6VP20_9AGAR|nr:hypothetical protein GGX14DRAFT_608533 [Mycena pura]